MALSSTCFVPLGKSYLAVMCHWRRFPVPSPIRKSDKMTVPEQHVLECWAPKHLQASLEIETALANACAPTTPLGGGFGGGGGQGQEQRSLSQHAAQGEVGWIR